MAVAEMGEVKGVLADFEPRIRSVVHASWVEFLDLQKARRFMYARTRANAYFDILAQNAIQEFEGDRHIRVLAKGSTVQFLFRERVLLRFKKANANGVGSNIETQEVLNFIDPQLNIPGLLPDVHRVEVCYQPDALGMQLQEVAVVARNRTKRVWAYPLEGGAIAEVIPLPARSPDEMPPTVIPKKRKKESKEQE
ncbi:hypothetical protein [Caenispirillum bisanense]|uniref:Uncharacterized protein n=1 Tax=Caenispirillum bisanense TaxID=414052 RepID=A0A286GYV3_9PROT|nr:hypothetical protein [Caenispirillum bisanense]SOE00715.1 hypothetical protein SAMN05421508_1141 [Caenispirillum bisanense]